MAEQHQTQFSDVITFNIFGDEDTNQSTIFTENLTQDEREEIATVVLMIEGANSQELINFTVPENNVGHKSVSESELDRLAGKNSAVTTQYQTKWAVTVTRGMFEYFLNIFFH